MDLDTLRAICLAHPGATEEVQWGNHLLFKVGGKMFCITNIDDANDTSFKVSDEHFDELGSTDDFMPAPHLARAKWLKVVRPQSLKTADWKQFISEAYAIVKAKLPKKVQASLS